MNNGLIVSFKKCLRLIRYLNQQTIFKPIYKLIGIIEDKNEEYIARIQIINKELVFYMKPNEILRNDNFVIFGFVLLLLLLWETFYILSFYTPYFLA